MESSKTYFTDEVHALFWNRAVHAALKLGFLDCRFCILAQQPQDVLVQEIRKVARALDNFTVFETCGWYAICDQEFNKVTLRTNLRKNLDLELKAREELFEAILSPGTRAQKFLELWEDSVDHIFEADLRVLGTLESRLKPELATQVLACAGNDWEFMVSFVMEKLEEHHKLNMIAQIVLEIQACLKKCSVVENARIRSAVHSALSPDMQRRVRELGFETIESQLFGEREQQKQFMSMSRQSSSIASPTQVEPRRVPSEFSRVKSPGFERDGEVITRLSRQSSATSLIDSFRRRKSSQNNNLIRPPSNKNAVLSPKRGELPMNA